MVRFGELHPFAIRRKVMDNLIMFSFGAVIVPIIVMVALFYAIMFVAHISWRVMSWQAN